MHYTRIDLEAPLGRARLYRLPGARLIDVEVSQKNTERMLQVHAESADEINTLAFLMSRALEGRPFYTGMVEHYRHALLHLVEPPKGRALISFTIEAPGSPAGD